MPRSGRRRTLRSVFVSPYHNPANSYTRRQIEDFEALGLEVGAITEALAGAWHIPRSAKLLVLNWFEDRLASARRPAVELVRSLVVLCLLKARIGHIVWVRHNHRPHAGRASDPLQRLFVAAIGRLASVAVRHRAVDGTDSLIVPHPLYGSPLAREQARKAKRDIPFLIPGSVRRNKGVPELLERWPLHLPLHIAGHCAEPALADQIASVIARRGLKVRWDDRFLEERELDALLARSSYVLLTNRDDTMIVSGVFHHAASFGANLLVGPGGFGEAMRARYDFVQPLDPERLEDLSYVDPSSVMDQIESANGRPTRLSAWRHVFDELNVAAPGYEARN